jgi:Cu2+-exporting ATPase
LIRNRTAFEKARNLQAIIFDKTGTLTEGKFGITDIITFENNTSRDELLKISASLERNSEHPIAKGIVADEKNFYSVENFRAIPGKGAEGLINGKNVKVVSPGYLKENKIEFTSNELDEISSKGKTIVFILIDNKPYGAIALADIIRPESKKAISDLKAMGIKSMMLTGDNKQVAGDVSEQLGLDEYFAEVLPDQKAAKVKEVQSRGLIVAMVGDGINDAPALAQADVGIAIGAGTDVAIETADIILVKSNPEDVVTLIRLARSTYSKMIQNLVWATGYNAFAIPLAAGVLYNFGILLSPAIGAILMALSTVIVAINARLLTLPKVNT